MSIIDHRGAADTLVDTLEAIGHGMYAREDENETTTVYSSNRRRRVILVDSDEGAWGVTNGATITEADRFDGPVDDDALTLLALWLASEVDPTAKAVHDAVAGLEDWESVVSDLSAQREGLSGILLSCLAGTAQVDVSFVGDSLAYVSVDVDPTFPDVSIPPSAPHQVGAILEAISNDTPYLDALIESLSSIYGITNYIDALGEFSDHLEVAAAPSRAGVVIGRGRDTLAAINGEGPWTMVDAARAEVTAWDDWTQMVAHVMQSF